MDHLREVFAFQRRLDLDIMQAVSTTWCNFIERHSAVLPLYRIHVTFTVSGDKLTVWMANRNVSREPYRRFELQLTGQSFDLSCMPRWTRNAHAIRTVKYASSSDLHSAHELIREVKPNWVHLESSEYGEQPLNVDSPLVSTGGLSLELTLPVLNQLVANRFFHQPAVQSLERLRLCIDTYCVSQGMCYDICDNVLFNLRCCKYAELEITFPTVDQVLRFLRTVIDTFKSSFGMNRAAMIPGILIDSYVRVDPSVLAGVWQKGETVCMTAVTATSDSFEDAVLECYDFESKLRRQKLELIHIRQPKLVDYFRILVSDS